VLQQYFHNKFSKNFNISARCLMDMSFPLSLKLSNELVVRFLLKVIEGSARECPGENPGRAVEAGVFLTKTAVQG
jgi:hypothetical protein